MLQRFARHLLAVDRKDASAAFAGAGTVVLEVEYERVFPRRELVKLSFGLGGRSQAPPSSLNNSSFSATNPNRIRSLVAEIGAREPVSYSRAHCAYLLGATFDRAALAKKGLAYERLDQLTMEVLLGVR
jgi:hypothetical protein